MRSNWNTHEVHAWARKQVAKLLADQGYRVVDYGNGPIIAQFLGGHEYRIYVLGARSLGYRWLLKHNIPAGPDDFAALVLFPPAQEVQTFLIPGPSFCQPSQHLRSLLKDRDYIGLQRLPEFGINLTESSLHLLDQFKFDNAIRTLK